MCRASWRRSAANSYGAYAWPPAFAGVFARNGIAIAIIAALCVAVFLVGFVALDDPAALLGVHAGPGAFYRLMPHRAMAGLFGAAFLYAMIALAMSLRLFWRDVATPGEPPTDLRALWQAIADTGRLRYLDGGGSGCMNEDETPDRSA